jgi:hypothetical protein
MARSPAAHDPGRLPRTGVGPAEAAPNGTDSAYLVGQAAEAGAFRLTGKQPLGGCAGPHDEDAERVLARHHPGPGSAEPGAAGDGRGTSASGLLPAATVRGWRPQLNLLVGTRDVLDYLRPEVYQRDLDRSDRRPGGGVHPARGSGVRPSLGRAPPAPRRTARPAPGHGHHRHRRRDEAPPDVTPWCWGDRVLGCHVAGTPPVLGWMARHRLRRTARALVKPGCHVRDLRVS